VLAEEVMGSPIEEMVFPTDAKGLKPAMEMLDNVCPTPVTVEPIEVKLFAIAPVN
jgi:hypothetical protein